jgi:hypothetical protein
VFIIILVLAKGFQFDDFISRPVMVEPSDWKRIDLGDNICNPPLYQ